MILHNGIIIDRENRVIIHGDKIANFNLGHKKTFPAFCHLILGGPMTFSHLFELVYGHDPDGGPLDGPHTFWVDFARWSAILRRLAALCLAFAFNIQWPRKGGKG